MSLVQTIVRLIVGLIAGVWTFGVLSIAAFAIPDRHDGIAVPVMGLLVFGGGMLPVAFFWFLFRDHLRPTRAVQPAPVATAEGTTAAPQATEVLVDPISDREAQVLRLIALGHSNKEIALQLSVTVGTVKTHTNNINRKLGTRTRTQALARARQLNLM